MPLTPGTQVGRYRIVRLLAQGGMAEVYRADQELTGGIFRPAALKVIRPEFSESPDFREMFLDEARTACTLSHPNIVHIYEVGEVDGLLHMAMELVAGQSLSHVARSMRERGERLSDEALLAVGVFTCSALEAVHALQLPGSGHLNLVHRDVSPHNLLLDPSGTLKLIDFGIAKAITNRNLTSPGITKGKAGYFSPEQAMGKPLDGRSDLFSLGVTLYKLASGGTPFDQHRDHTARNTALVHGRWDPLEKVCPGLPRAFYAAVARALQVQPEDRFDSARQMREVLERLAVDSGIHLGTSSLSGYVAPEEHSGTASKVSAAIPMRRRTERVMPPPQTLDVRAAKQTQRVLWLLVAASVAVIAVTAALLWRSRTARAWPVPVEMLAVRPDGEFPPPVTGPGLQVSPTSTATPTPTPQPVRAAKSESPRRPRMEPVSKVAEPVAEEPIPKGEGWLRIGAEPDGEVRVAGKSYGTTPLHLPIPSGKYKVEISKPGGRPQSSYTVKVMPDHTVRLRYSFVGNRWDVD